MSCERVSKLWKSFCKRGELCQCVLQRSAGSYSPIIVPRLKARDGSPLFGGREEAMGFATSFLEARVALNDKDVKTKQHEHNALPSVLGQPGCGKSLFLAQLGKELMGKGDWAVACFTYNAAMEGRLSDTDREKRFDGLTRILWSAMAVGSQEAGAECPNLCKWDEAIKLTSDLLEDSSFQSFRVSDVISEIRAVTGKRKVAILIDELSKARIPESFWLPGEILAVPGTAVIVSSLTPFDQPLQYITRSQRPIVHKPLGSVGLKVMEDIIDQMIALNQVSSQVEDDIRWAVGQSGGHARSLELLMEEWNDKYRQKQGDVKVVGRSTLFNIYNGRKKNLVPASLTGEGVSAILVQPAFTNPYHIEEIDSRVAGMLRQGIFQRYQGRDGRLRLDTLPYAWRTFLIDEQDMWQSTEGLVGMVRRFIPSDEAEISSQQKQIHLSERGFMLAAALALVRGRNCAKVLLGLEGRKKMVPDDIVCCERPSKDDFLNSVKEKMKLLSGKAWIIPTSDSYEIYDFVVVVDGEVVAVSCKAAISQSTSRKRRRTESRSSSVATGSTCVEDEGAKEREERVRSNIDRVMINNKNSSGYELIGLLKHQRQSRIFMGDDIADEREAVVGLEKLEKEVPLSLLVACEICGFVR